MTSTNPTGAGVRGQQAPGSPTRHSVAGLPERQLGGYALVAAVGACVAAPLLGLAYFRTADGREELESGSVSWWADPVTEWLDPLLTWAGPDRVYSTYVQALAVLFPAVLLCARHARRRRTTRTRAERVGWRVTLVGYCLALAGIALVAASLAVASPDSAAVGIGFIALMVPGMLLSVIGSTVLGVSLVRGRWEPRLTAWLLAAAFPFFVAASLLLGHNSLGMLVLFLAWAAYGGRLLTPQVPGRTADAVRARDTGPEQGGSPPVS